MKDGNGNDRCCLRTQNGRPQSYGLEAAGDKSINFKTGPSALGAQGLSVMGVTSDPVNVAGKTAQALDMRYAVASDGDEATAGVYGVRALPTMFVIDKKGVIRDVFVGYDPGRHKEVETLLKTLLAEK